MAPKFHKHKLLLDEGLAIRSYFPILNSRFDVKHIAEDFKPLIPTSDKTGVIDVSANLSYKQIDKKLTAFLNRSTRKSLLGRITQISGETEAE